MIVLRPAKQEDYPFALDLYVDGIRAYTEAWMVWEDEVQAARFAANWRVTDTRIIVLEAVGEIGWLDVELSAGEAFLRQLYMSRAHRGRGLGAIVMRRLIVEWGERSAKLSVLLNNPARRFYERCGFVPEREDGMRLWMRRQLPTSAA